MLSNSLPHQRTWPARRVAARDLCAIHHGGRPPLVTSRLDGRRCWVDRCALFVDAGYVLGDGAMAVHGTRNRESVSWDYAGVLQVLKNVARDHTGLPLLRCYWYEAAAESRRGAEHNTLADLSGVKLRLGRMRSGHREGVESEIHRDLTTLARNRAISDALVVSAEEDLAQVIAQVQDLGIRVALVHIAAPGWTAPAVLRQECDDIVEISEAHLRPSVELVVGAEPVSEEERHALYASRTPANGRGPSGVIGQPQAPRAGSHAAPPAIYTGAAIAEYQRAAQPANSQPPAAANASEPLNTSQPRAGENGLVGLAPGGAGFTAPSPSRPAAPPGIAAPPGPQPGITGPPGPLPSARIPDSRDMSGPPTLPTQPVSVDQPGVAPQPGMAPEPGGVPQPGMVPQPGAAAQPAAGSHPGLPPRLPAQAGPSQAGAAAQPPSGLTNPSAMPGQHAASGQHAAPAQPAMSSGQPALPPAQLSMPSGQPAMPSGQPAMPSGQS